MIPRDYYLELITEIRNIEKISIDNYIKERLEPLIQQDDYFIEILYKDIHYLIKDIDKDGENDLLIRDKSLVVENGEIQLAGYQSSLHSIVIWLHMQIIEKHTIDNDPILFIKKMEDFEKHYLNKPNYTPEYKAKLDKIKESLIEEREQNSDEKNSTIKRIKRWIKTQKVAMLSGGGIIIVVITILSFFQQITGYTFKDFITKDESIGSEIVEISKSDSLIAIDKKNVIDKASKEVFENFYKTILSCEKKYVSISALNHIKNYAEKEASTIDKRILNNTYIDRYAINHKYWTESDYNDVARILRTKTIFRIEEIFEDVENQAQGPFVFSEDKLKTLKEIVKREFDDL